MKQPLLRQIVQDYFLQICPAMPDLDLQGLDIVDPFLGDQNIKRYFHGAIRLERTLQFSKSNQLKTWM
jgi:hypothetical protein